MHRFQFFFCTQIDIGFNSISHRPLKKHSCTIYCIKIIFMASSESNSLAVCLLSQVTLFWIFEVLYLSFVSLETDRTGRPQARSTCITLCGEEEVNYLLLANTLCAYLKIKCFPAFHNMSQPNYLFANLKEYVFRGLLITQYYQLFLWLKKCHCFPRIRFYFILQVSRFAIWMTIFQTSKFICILRVFSFSGILNL